MQKQTECSMCSFYKEDLQTVIAQRERAIKREMEAEEKVNDLINERKEIMATLKEMFEAKKIFEEQLIILESKILNRKDLV